MSENTTSHTQDDSWYVNITDDTFQEQVVQNPCIVIVEFGAPYLGACQMLAPVLEAVSVTFKGLIQIKKLDAYKNPTAPRAWGIQALPTLLIYNDGHPVDHITGVVSTQVLTEKLNNLLGDIPQNI